MRLLRIHDDRTVSLVERVGGNIPAYCILSHTWGPDEEEVNFQDLVDGTGTTKDGYDKIQFCARQAMRDELEYCWIDTCCIDKSNSSELTEAINSMFRWYRKAEKCYVYLSDVSSSSTYEAECLPTWEPQFRESRWFTRGWTLQELLAPFCVEFFSKEGFQLGDKHSLEQTIHEITKIPVLALQGHRLSSFSQDERFSWTEHRKTKREEDAAYCLLGIFDIFMPLIYGEGRQNALDRLSKAVREDLSVNLPVAIGASFSSYMEEHNSRCLPYTRTELLDGIIRWAKDPNSKPIFWLNGMAGTGKSTIARTVAQLFSDQLRLGASFFFKKGESSRSNATRFFTTIATELMTSVPEARPAIRKAVNTDPRIADKTLKDQFEKLIIQPLSEAALLRPLDLVIVIDALDECEGDDDIRTILQLLSRINYVQSISLRIFVTGRPEYQVRLGFRQMPDGSYESLVLHEVALNVVEHDIRVYLQHELGKIQKERSLPVDWPNHDQINALVARAVPLFIFAATVCRYIGDARDNPQRRLDIVLQAEKRKITKLEATYLPILEQLFDEEDQEDKDVWMNGFQTVVGSIVILQSPLSTLALAGLLKITMEDIRCRLDSFHSVLDVPQSEELPIQLLHLSFRDFLLDTRIETDGRFRLDESERNSVLVSNCLQVMSDDRGLRKNICNLEAVSFISSVPKEVITNSIRAELRYACRFWVDHLEKSQRPIAYMDETHVFLQRHFLHWLEAMSVLGENNATVQLVSKLETLIAVRLYPIVADWECANIW